MGVCVGGVCQLMDNSVAQVKIVNTSRTLGFLFVCSLLEVFVVVYLYMIAQFSSVYFVVDFVSLCQKVERA